MPDYLRRVLDVNRMVEKRSHFLFGPRQTGKTSLILQTVRSRHLYNLLESDTFLTLSREPWRLRQEVSERGSLVVIDEIQKLPGLLDEVQWLIEERNVRFLLTGSSARKLRRGGVNLLGGRARTRYLHPLTCRELGAHFDLARAIERGLLPSIYFSDDPRADLAAYTGTYLQQRT